MPKKSEEQTKKAILDLVESLGKHFIDDLKGVAAQHKELAAKCGIKLMKYSAQLALARIEQDKVKMDMLAGEIAIVNSQLDDLGDASKKVVIDRVNGVLETFFSAIPKLLLAAA